MSLSQSERVFLLRASRRSMENILRTGDVLKYASEVVPKKLLQNGYTYVTLFNHDRVAGSMGDLDDNRSILDSVIHSSILAAFNDPVLPPLTPLDLNRIKITISILTKFVPLEVSSSADLLKKISVGKTGLLVKSGKKSAILMPILWKEFNSKEDFLSRLCANALLPLNYWKTNLSDLKFYSFESEDFSESILKSK
ncbi:AmmeMemoRadiSam system protein A [Candidatus Micrarchaeota archaeon]|nr:AmmeMemoRadiSam system protein A [Candidatus Micrarchaeota archaeon]